MVETGWEVTGIDRFPNVHVINHVGANRLP
jgi:hypothetical protein